jgi:membrane-bound metal-dependent hydrolase YbcI (DUF457 family)
VDPLSHAALGRTLAALAWGQTGVRLGSDQGQTQRGGSRRRTTAAAVLGALSPDLDAIAIPFGWDRYLRLHEIGTHSLAGTLACALVTATLVRLFTRNASWKALAWSAWLGAASHVLLDLISSARIRVFWPLFDRQLSIPLVAMADPWLATILVTALPALWIAGRYKRVMAAAMVAVTSAFLGWKAAVATRAVATYRSAQTTTSASYLVEARWASLREWHVFDRTERHLRAWRIAADHPPQLMLSWPLEDTGGAIAASQTFSAVRNLRDVHALAFPVRFAQPDGGEQVLWSDIRFCWNGSNERARQIEPIAISGDLRVSCALWAGVAFDPRGAALEQIVRIAGFTQRRPPGD